VNLGIELLAGTLLAVISVALVLEPLFRPVDVVDSAPADPARDDDWDADVMLTATPRARALAALKEIEFDRETGKLDDSDYQTLKARYTREAVEAMRAEQAVTAPTEESEAVTAAVAAVAVGGVDSLDALAEARIAKARARASAPRAKCPTCGPRPEADATFCSNCGRPLTS